MSDRNQIFLIGSDAIEFDVELPDRLFTEDMMISDRKILCDIIIENLFKTILLSGRSGLSIDSHSVDILPNTPLNPKQAGVTIDVSNVSTILTYFIVALSGFGLGARIEDCVEVFFSDRFGYSIGPGKMSIGYGSPFEVSVGCAIGSHKFNIAIGFPLYPKESSFELSSSKGIDLIEEPILMGRPSRIVLDTTTNLMAQTSFTVEQSGVALGSYAKISALIYTKLYDHDNKTLADMDNASLNDLSMIIDE